MNDPKESRPDGTELEAIDGSWSIPPQEPGPSAERADDSEEPNASARHASGSKAAREAVEASEEPSVARAPIGGSASVDTSAPPIAPEVPGSPAGQTATTADSGVLAQLRARTLNLPLWAVVGALIAAAAAFGALGFGLGRGESTTQSTVVETLSPALLARARTGDPDALKRIEEKPVTELASSEALALARGQSELLRQEIAALRERLAQDPGLIDKPDVVEELLRLARESRTTVDALSAMAALPGPESADLIYEVWTGVAERTFATTLAQNLVYSRDVSAKASPALKVALDLRREEDCAKVAEIVRRGREHGDQRSLHLLARLLHKKGCGPKKMDDCFACLRGSDELKAAMQAVKERPAPKW